ncbi:MAG: serine/threonine protein kinase [Planctomycetaceae bacterium]|nr:serine/threonine protein kinase [Planctomycetaceae bacterium]
MVRAELRSGDPGDRGARPAGDVEPIAASVVHGPQSTVADEAARAGSVDLADGATLITPALEPSADRDSNEAASFAATLISSSEPGDTHPDGDSGTAAVESWGAYDILDEIARGGMGVVYRARQRKLNRVVALKVILAGSHAGQEALERFRIEAETIAGLQHPNIVQIHEVGEHAGLPFLSLEFCSGGNLARKLDGTPQPSREAAAMVETLARAMHAAHQANVVHRDLKPANVLFTADGTPKVTDFGLAKKLDDQGQTQTGTIMGTPSYMSPEQAAGKHHAVGPTTDIYALGAILYESLTGRPPFKAATPLETVMQVLHEEPVPPVRIQPRTPKDLDTISLKCLHKDPARRYASAAELADDLQRYLNDEPALARPVGRIERMFRWCRRNPSRAAAALLGVLVLVGAIVVPIVLAVREAQNASQLAAEQKKTQDALDASLTATKLAQAAEKDKPTSCGSRTSIERGPGVPAGWWGSGSKVSMRSVKRPRSGAP